MQMLYKDMFHVDDASIPDTRCHSDEFEQQGSSFETLPLPPPQSGPKLGQQHSLMSNPEDWPDALFTPSVVDVVTEMMRSDSGTVSATTTATSAASVGSDNGSATEVLVETNAVETTGDTK